MHELGELEKWVRTVAVPHLVAGTHDVQPLPPQLDTTVGHDDTRAAFAASGDAPAAERASRRIQAASSRQGLVESLAPLAARVGSEVISAWLNSLDDDQILENMDRLTAAAPDGMRVIAVARDLVAEAEAWSNELSPPQQ